MAKKVATSFQGKAIVKNHRNGSTQVVIIKDGKWIQPENNKEWPETLKKLYTVVEEVSAESTPEAKKVVEGKASTEGNSQQ
jgi:hypothetical protein